MVPGSARNWIAVNAVQQSQNEIKNVTTLLLRNSSAGRHRGVVSFSSLAFLTILSGSLMAWLQPNFSTYLSGEKRTPATTLNFSERVTYQRAIEEVYWRHRIWPKANGAKPSLDELMSADQIKGKVEAYLCDSQALEQTQPITAEQLQAEMDRMAQHTRQPKVLRELFAALENDPAVIAECLARPTLTARLIAGVARDKAKSFSALGGSIATMSIGSVAQGASYTLPQISGTVAAPVTCTDDTWMSTEIGPPDAREHQTAVWTGSEMIIWGGTDNSADFGTGSRYDPAIDDWSATSR